MHKIRSMCHAPRAREDIYVRVFSQPAPYDVTREVEVERRNAIARGEKCLHNPPPPHHPHPTPNTQPCPNHSPSSPLWQCTLRARSGPAPGLAPYAYYAMPRPHHILALQLFALLCLHVQCPHVASLASPFAAAPPPPPLVPRFAAAVARNVAAHGSTGCTGTQPAPSLCAKRSGAVLRWCSRARARPTR